MKINSPHMEHMRYDLWVNHAFNCSDMLPGAWRANKPLGWSDFSILNHLQMSKWLRSLSTILNIYPHEFVVFSCASRKPATVSASMEWDTSFTNQKSSTLIRGSLMIPNKNHIIFCCHMFRPFFITALNLTTSSDHHKGSVPRYTFFMLKPRPGRFFLAFLSSNTKERRRRMMRTRYTF